MAETEGQLAIVTGGGRGKYLRCLLVIVSRCVACFKSPPPAPTPLGSVPFAPPMSFSVAAFISAPLT